MSRIFRFAAPIALALLCAPPAGSARAAQPPDAEREFRRGLTSLHEFEYEEANEAFRRAQTLDSGFVLAYWGEALTYHQSLWGRENIDAARKAIARLGPTPAARARKCRTPKEADLLAAAETLFGAGDAASRRRGYADAMATLHGRYPDDADVAAQYGLSLLATMSRGLTGSEDVHEGHSQDLAGSDIQARVTAILQKVLESHPQHRGALHYLLHAYDDPAHAARALSAARNYAKIAEASHARHMPAHIFLQLGLWEEAAASDRAAYDASVEWAAQRGLGAALRNYHALSWLHYELLQLGRYRDAEEAMSALEPIAKTGDNAILLSDLSSMRARSAVETERWDSMAGQDTFANVNDLFAIGLSAVRSGQADKAEHVRGVLAGRAQAKEEGALKPAIAVMERELAALIALAAGRTDEAVATLISAAAPSSSCRLRSVSRNRSSLRRSCSVRSCRDRQTAGGSRMVRASPWPKREPIAIDPRTGSSGRHFRTNGRRAAALSRTAGHLVARRRERALPRGGARRDPGAGRHPAAGCDTPHPHALDRIVAERSSRVDCCVRDPCRRSRKKNGPLRRRERAEGDRRNTSLRSDSGNSTARSS